MNLTVRRHPCADCTPGELLINGVHECWTLEPPLASAIPAGRYRVVIDASPRFGRDMPHVLDVPGFEGIRIHIGNTIADTEGCLLLGLAKGESQVIQSKLAFDAFFPKLQAALADSSQVWIEYVNPEEPV